MTALSTIMPTTSSRMLWADLEVESDSELNDSSSDHSRFSGSILALLTETGFKRQGSESPSCATSSSDDDAPLLSLASIPMRSGTCTPSSTASYKSRNCLRNMRLTKEHLQKLQSTPRPQCPTFEDMDASSSLWDASSTFSNAIVNSDVSTNIMQSEPVQSDLSVDTTGNTEKGLSVGQWSVGSVGHDSGCCKPCMFLFSKTGCFAGTDCQFCHFSHCRSKFPRPSKGKRDRIKRLLSSALEQEDPKEALRKWVQSVSLQTS